MFVAARRRSSSAEDEGFDGFDAERREHRSTGRRISVKSNEAEDSDDFNEALSTRLTPSSNLSGINEGEDSDESVGQTLRSSRALRTMVSMSSMPRGVEHKINAIIGSRWSQWKRGFEDGVGDRRGR
jgi:hypothetical protein